MKKRHGFLMLWLLIGVMAVTVMGVAVFLIFYQMVIYEEERETETDSVRCMPPRVVPIGDSHRWKKEI